MQRFVRTAGAVGLALGLMLGPCVSAAGAASTTRKTVKNVKKTVKKTVKKGAATTVPKPATKVSGRAPSLPAFCTASKTWLDWETVTLQASGGLDDKWVADTIAYYSAVAKSSPDDIHRDVVTVGASLVQDRQLLVGVSQGRIDVMPGIELLTQTAAELAAPGNSAIAAAERVAAYMLAKCNVDFQAPWKALEQATSGGGS